MQSTQTYTRRENARRAGIAAGVSRDRVDITVHKDGNEVRFGWKECEEPVKKSSTTGTPAFALKVEQNVRNGVKRPKAVGVCAAVWAWLDAHPHATAREAKEVAASIGWNPNNVACEYYGWRKFHGISGRKPKTA